VLARQEIVTKSKTSVPKPTVAAELQNIEIIIDAQALNITSDSFTINWKVKYFSLLSESDIFM
jgi:hypothetical protein